MFQMQRCGQCGNLATHGTQLDGYTCDLHYGQQQAPAREPAAHTLPISEAVVMYANDVLNQYADHDWMLDNGILPSPTNDVFGSMVELMANGYTHLTLMG